MKKTYQVAGHKFSVTMPDGSTMWNIMGQYEPFLSDESGEHVFDVTLVDEVPNMEGWNKVTEEKQRFFPVFEFYENNEGWLWTLSQEDDLEAKSYLMCDKAFSKARLCFVGKSRAFLHNMLSFMFAAATANRNTLMIHSSVTLHGGKGYLFLGKSGTGKSTHSQLWIKNIEGCELLNDDHPVLKVENDGSVRVYGSPWSGKTPCYRNLSAPVGAIVDLHQAPKNAIRRQMIYEAYGSVFKSFSGLRFIKECADGFHATNERIVTTVPFYSLDCLPDAEAAWLCFNTVAQ